MAGVATVAAPTHLTRAAMQCCQPTEDLLLAFVWEIAGLSIFLS